MSDDRVPLNYKVRPVVKKRILQLSTHLGLNETAVVTQAVNELYERHRPQIQPANLQVTAENDD